MQGLLKQHQTSREGLWIQDPLTTATKRFHCDHKKNSESKQKVFIDSGRPLPHHHALLKSRSYVDIEDATKLLNSLRDKGWIAVPPQWGDNEDI